MALCRDPFRSVEQRHCRKKISIIDHFDSLGNILNLIMQVELESRILRAKKYIALTWPLKKSSSIYRSKRIQNDEKDC